MEEIEVVIVGAGISGLATALGLHRKGIRSLVLESSDSLRSAGFALLIWPNAWRALDALGVGDLLRETHVRLQGLVMNSAITGEVVSKRTFIGDEQSLNIEVRSLKRNLLLETLSKDLPPETIRFSSKVVYITLIGKLKALHLSDGSTLKTKVLIGCDGVNSVVAQWLGLRRPSFSGRSACRGIVDNPESSIVNRRLIEYFFGEGFRVGISHCDEVTLYWFFTWTPSNQAEKEAEESAEKMRELMLNKLTSSKMPKEVIELIEKTDRFGLASASLRFRWPFDLLWGNICKDNVCVAGDAFHPMTPDIGQGGCSALEDAVVLARCLGEAFADDGNNNSGEEESHRVAEGLNKYARERRWRSIAVIAAAYLIGRLEEGEGSFFRFLKEKLLSGFISWMLLKITEFDCGRL